MAELPPSSTASEEGLLCGLVQLRVNDQTSYAYEARPDDDRPRPAILLFHEKYGLTPYLRGVARRLARAGYLAMAPDFFLLALGGHVVVERVDEACSTALRVPPRQMLRLARSFAEYLRQAKPSVTGLAALGFCWGGEQVYRFAASDPRLRAAVSFYGNAPAPITLLRAITCPVLSFYGGEDACVPAVTGRRIERLMRKYHKPFELVIQPGARHAFHNDTLPTHYDPRAAEAAFQRTLAFLHRHLG
ncbi:MAG: dienelactone hydrolase family protein [Candidatus Tectomicrobia bacterium]|nr:dienelactone hydrolase family protein [Candidatus Tectomicrobia bacterium]